LDVLTLKLSEFGFEQAAIARYVIYMRAQTGGCDVQHDQSSAVANGVMRLQRDCPYLIRSTCVSDIIVIGQNYFFK
jgi:hypothetical protein